MYFNSLESFEILLVFSNKHKLPRVSDGGNLTIRKRWCLAGGDQTGSFKRMPFRGLLVIVQHGEGSQHDFAKIMLP